MPVTFYMVIDTLIVVESGSYFDTVWKQRKKCGPKHFL